MADVKFIDFIGDIVDSIRQRASIVSITNTPSTTNYVVVVTDLLDLAVEKMVSIGGVEYQITAINALTPSFTVSASVAPVGTEFKTSYPFYIHGRFIAANNELNNVSNAFKKYPLIYLAENYSTRENLDPNLQVGDNVSCSIFIMNSANYEDFTTDEHYTYVIDEMDSIANSFIDKIKSNQFVQYREFSELERIRHPKWGLEVTNKGTTTNLFDDNLSGVEIRLQIPIRKSINHCGRYNDIDFRNCADVTIFKDGVFLESVPSGSSFSYTNEGGDVEISINQTVYSTEAAPGTINIPVINSASTDVGTVNPGVNVTIGDSTIQVNGTNFDTTEAESTFDVPVVNTLDQAVGTVIAGVKVEIQNGIVQVNNENVLNTIPESTVGVDVLNTLDNTVGTNEGFGVWRIGDSTVEINDVVIGTVPAEDTVGFNVIGTDSNPKGSGIGNGLWQIADSIVQINGVTFENAISESTINVPVKNSNGDSIGVVDPGVQVNIEDSFVENSDLTYSNQFASGTTLILPDVTITQKNSANTTIGSSIIAASVDKNVTVVDTPIKNSAGTLQANAPSGVDYTVPNDTVTNSDASVTVNNVIQGVIKVLTDVTMTKPNGTTEAWPSMKNYSCTQIAALSTQDLNNKLTPTQINQIQRHQPTRTGQTTSYRTGDDGDLEMGTGASFSTLSDNNIFGNTNRFTDETGAQTYTNNFVLDHLTGLMWYRSVFASAVWNTAIDGAEASAQGGFTDWHIPNVNQISTIINHEIADVLNYAPFNISISAVAGDRLWTSNTNISVTTQAVTVRHYISSTPCFESVGKTSTRKYIYMRKFIPSDFGL